MVWCGVSQSVGDHFSIELRAHSHSRTYADTHTQTHLRRHTYADTLTQTHSHIHIHTDTNTYIHTYRERKKMSLMRPLTDRSMKGSPLCFRNSSGGGADKEKEQHQQEKRKVCHYDHKTYTLEIVSWSIK